MNTPNLGTLPPQIIKIMLEKIGHSYNRAECRPVNKQWYSASLSVIYNLISINCGVVNSDKKAVILCVFLENSSCNAGQYIKQVQMYSIDHLDILGSIMKHCPNVTKFTVMPTKEILDCIVSFYKSEDKALWSKLQQLHFHQMNLEDINCYYSILHCLRKCLSKLYLQYISDLSSVGDDRRGTEEDLYAYIKEFVNLKSLNIHYNAISCLFGCENFFSTVHWMNWN